MSTAISVTPRRASLGMMSDRGDLQTTKNEPYVEGNLKICHIIEGQDNIEVMSVRFSPDGNYIAVGQVNATIRIHKAENGQLLFALSDDDTKKSRLPVTSMRFKSYDDNDRHILMATYASGLVKFWHYTSGNCLHTINEGTQTLSSAFNPHTTGFVTCGADPKINVYDFETKKRLKTLEPSDSRDVMNGHRSRVFSIQYHPHRPHAFVTGGWDDTVQFWDDRQQHAVRKFFGPHICGDALDIDPVHNHIVTGSWRKENVLQIWDFDAGEKIKDVPEDPMHRSLLYSAQWLGKENIMCGGCKLNMLRVIDRGTLNTVGQLVDLPVGVTSIDNDRQNKPRIAAASANKVYILKMEKHQ